MISSPFTLTQLSNSKPSVVVDGPKAYVGISQNCISLQSLKPPQELEAWSVSPGTDITAVAVGDVVFYATKERKKTLLKSTNGLEVIVPQVVRHLYIADSTLFCIYENFQIDAYSISDLKLRWSTEPSKEKVVFTAMMDDTSCCVVSQFAKKYKASVVQLQSSSCTQSATNLSWSVGPAQWALKDSTLFLGRGSRIYQTDIYSGSELVMDVQADVVDMIAVSSSKVCAVLEDLSLVAIDTDFQAQVAQLQLENPTELVAFSEEAQIILAASDNMLIGFPLELSSGSLIDSIAKGIQSTSLYKFGFCDIINVHAPAKDAKSIAQTRLAEATQLNRRIVLDFTKYFEAQSQECLGIVGWLKGGEWHDPGVVVYQDTDRQVDKDIVVTVANLVFNLREKPKYAEFLPNSIGLYLLTHPLFPVCNVFPALQEPQLYHQAIVSLRGISASSLIMALSDPNEDIFNDAVERLGGFSHDQIKQGYAAVAKDLKSASLGKLLSRLGAHPNGAFLISPLIDVVGLHSWDRRMLQSLDKKLAGQVEYLRAAELTKTALSELLKEIDIDLKAGSSVSHSEIKRKSRKGVANELRKGEKKQIPSYGVEELVFA